MKQFLYLDTDIVNSIIAQSEKGLVQEQSHEDERNNSNETRINGTLEGNASAEGAFLKLAKAEANLSASGEIGKNLSEGTTSRDIISKVLHDAAFDIACAYINPKLSSVEDSERSSYGDYVKLTRRFSVVDMEYLQNLFSENGLIDFMKKSSKEKNEAEANKRFSEELNHEQLRAANKKIKETLNKLNADSNKQLDEAHSIIMAFRELVPYSRMLVSDDGYLIPLDDKYFRINPKDLTFKYGGEITCVGMITNIITAGEKPKDSKNLFETLKFTANEALRTVLPTSSDHLYVINPIAVFYGE